MIDADFQRRPQKRILARQKRQARLITPDPGFDPVSEVDPEVHPEIDPEVDLEVDPEVDPEVDLDVDPEVHPVVDPESNIRPLRMEQLSAMSTIYREH